MITGHQHRRGQTYAYQRFIKTEWPPIERTVKRPGDIEVTSTGFRRVESND